MTAPAGWYPDPGRAELVRWWDGSAWTEHVQPLPPAVSVPSLETSDRPTNQRFSDPDVATLEARRNELRRECEELEATVLELRDSALLQEVGIYEYSHPLDSSAAYKEALRTLEERIDAAIKSGVAVVGTKKWAINGSATDGAKMVAEFGKLMLRA